jgi:hypothetical protein
MELFAVFETWHLGDGNYPPLKKGELVNLSFEFCLEELKLDQIAASTEFRHMGHARYQFIGTVLRVYGKDSDSHPIVVVRAGDFSFYIDSPLAATLRPGDMVNAHGTLLFDHYVWVEFLSDYPDPPDLFYKLRVSDILKRKMPERFITRSERGIGFPTWVASEEYGPDDISRVDCVSEEGFVDYVIQFTDFDISDEPIARTFYS